MPTVVVGSQSQIGNTYLGRRLGVDHPDVYPQELNVYS